MITLTNVSKNFDERMLLDDVTLSIFNNERIGLTGPNGAGKTSLLGQLTGEVSPESGSIHFNGVDITRMPPHRRARLGIGRSFQITSIFQDLTVLENVRLAVQVHAGHSFRFWSPVAGQVDLEQPAKKLLERVGLGSFCDMPASHLSHGQHRQLEIAIALSGQPTLLLLDEPMAGMGVEDSHQLTQMLLSMKGSVTMLLVEHDMDAVFALADRISVLVYGKCIATGTPAEIRANVEVRRASLGDGKFG